jgi:hypothetical protein
MQICPTPVWRRANASSTVLTMMTRDAPLANATAAVENAWKTSMMATTPLARVAPVSWLSILISTLTVVSSRAAPLTWYSERGSYASEVTESRQQTRLKSGERLRLAKRGERLALSDRGEYSLYIDVAAPPPHLIDCSRQNSLRIAQSLRLNGTER